MGALLRLSYLLCLVLALSDPLLREWEAASDLALSLAELRLGDSLNVIEPVDDGVADDPGMAILNAGSDCPVTHASVASLEVPDNLLWLLLLASTPSGLDGRSWLDRPPRLPFGLIPPASLAPVLPDLSSVSAD